MQRPTQALALELAGESQVERYRYSFNGEDPHPSKVLQKFSTPDQRLGELWDEMLTDLALSGMLDKRARAVLGLKRRIVPANGTPEAERIADFVREVMAGIPDLHTNLFHQYMSLFRGVAHEENFWAHDEAMGRWVVRDMKDRPLHRFAYVDGDLRVRRPDSTLLKPHPLKFLVARYGTKDQSWGKPTADELYRYYWFKKHGLKWWAIRVDKFAMPTVWGKYPQGTSKEDQDALLATLDRIQTEYTMVLPDDVMVDFLEATSAGGASYENYAAYADRNYAVKLFGEVDTSGQGKGPGSYAKSEVSERVRVETIREDAHRLETHWSDNWIAPLVIVNFGPLAPLPKLQIEVVDAEDRAMRQGAIATALKDGVPVPLSYYRMTHQIPAPREGEPIVNGMQGDAA